MNGILLIDKETDWTSHDAAAKLKGVLHERRIGHSGTLDPLATGLLVMFVGRATRAVQFAEADVKEYVAAMRLGIITDTQDITGNVLTQSNVNVSDEEFIAVLERFKGEIEQIPPMYSAIKINGKKLYELARKGQTAERASRKITIEELEFLGKRDGDFLLRIRCSKGTYIRTLCSDIGEALGCGAVMTELRRTKAGVFNVDDARTVAQIKEIADSGDAESLLLPVDSLFSEFPEVSIDSEAERRCRCGNDFPCNVSDGQYRVYSASGEFLMLGKAKKGRMITIKSFFEV